MAGNELAPRGVVELEHVLLGRDALGVEVVGDWRLAVSEVGALVVGGDAHLTLLDEEAQVKEVLDRLREGGGGLRAADVVDAVVVTAVYADPLQLERLFVKVGGSRPLVVFSHGLSMSRES